MTGDPMPGADVMRHVGARLRAARERARMSLTDVEEASGGVWKAVVVGSYERADRAVRLGRLWDLAAWYGVPFTSLFPPADAAEREAAVLRSVVADAASVLASEAARRLRAVPDVAVPCPRPAGNREETTT